MKGAPFTSKNSRGYTATTIWVVLGAQCFETDGDAFREWLHHGQPAPEKKPRATTPRRRGS